MATRCLLCRGPEGTNSQHGLLCKQSGGRHRTKGNRAVNDFKLFLINGIVSSFSLYQSGVYSLVSNDESSCSDECSYRKIGEETYDYCFGR